MSVNQTGTGNKQDTYEEEFQQNEFEVGFTELIGLEIKEGTETLPPP